MIAMFISGTGRPIAINPDFVRTVEPDRNNPESTIIEMAVPNKDRIIVNAQYEDVVEMLNGQASPLCSVR